MSSKQRGTEIRKEKLMSKLLSRVATELGRLRVNVTSELIDEARAALSFKWNEHGGSLTDNDLRLVVKSLRGAAARSQTVAENRTVLPEIASPAAPRAATPAADSIFHPPSELQSLLLHTTKKQRLMLADQEWIQAAERDRVEGHEHKIEEKRHHHDVMRQQKEILDRQMEERRRQQEQERLDKLRRQKEMDEIIQNAKEMERNEQLNALRKAQKEREFREKQQQEIEAERERQRIAEHNEQVRLVMANQAELRRQREMELARKAQGQEEWKKTVADNQLKLLEKEKEKERVRELDREYQRKYVEAQEKQERERAEAKERKEKRAQYFAKLAGGVAALFQAKEQDQSSKIEAEYQRQLQRSMEDEQNRQRRSKMRLQQCLEMQQSQIAEKKRRDEEEREEARRYAESLRQQAQETLAIEAAKKQAAREAALRTRNFLGTQLQLAHFKETRPMETSIARPASRAKSMYSPSRDINIPDWHHFSSLFHLVDCALRADFHMHRSDDASAESLKVLAHWSKVIGARSGVVSVRLTLRGSHATVLDAVRDEQHSAAHVWVLERVVPNDFDPVVVLVEEDDPFRIVGGFLALRLAPTSRAVEQSLSEEQQLVELWDAPLALFELQPNELEADDSEPLLVHVDTVPCGARFVVRDICVAAVCEKCDRGAQRCQCSPEERFEFLTERGRRALRLALASCDRPRPRVVAEEREECPFRAAGDNMSSDGMNSDAALDEAHAAANDSFSTYIVVESTRKTPHCGRCCALQ